MAIKKRLIVMYAIMNCIYLSLSPSLPPPPSRFPALLIWYRRRRWRMRLTDSGGFLLILPPSVLLAIPLSAHPCPLQRESSCVSVSVSRRAAGERGRVPRNKHPAKFIPSPISSLPQHPSSLSFCLSFFHFFLHPLCSIL